LSTEGVIDRRTGVEFGGGGWLEVESTNSSLGVWNVKDILDLENISGGSTVLLHLEGNSLLVFDYTNTTVSNSLGRVFFGTGTTVTDRGVTSEASGSHFSNDTSARGPFVNFTGQVTLGTNNSSSSASGSSRKLKFEEGFVSSNGQGSGPSVSTASTGDGTGWEGRSSELEVLAWGDIEPEDVLAFGKWDWGFHGELNLLSFGGLKSSLTRFTATSRTDVDGLLLGLGWVSIHTEGESTISSSSPDGDTSDESSGSNRWDEIFEMDFGVVTSSSGVTPSALSLFSGGVRSNNSWVLRTDSVSEDSSTSDTSTGVT
jgi:hypothetical protein